MNVGATLADDICAGHISNGCTGSNRRNSKHEFLHLEFLSELVFFFDLRKPRLHQCCDAPVDSLVMGNYYPTPACR